MGVHAYTCCMCVYTCMCVHMRVCVCVCVHACVRERERESRNIINSQYNNTRECIDCFWRLKALYNLKKNMQRANAIYIYITAYFLVTNIIQLTCLSKLGLSESTSYLQNNTVPLQLHVLMPCVK